MRKSLCGVVAVRRCDGLIRCVVVKVGCDGQGQRGDWTHHPVPSTTILGLSLFSGGVLAEDSPRVATDSPRVAMDSALASIADLVLAHRVPLLVFVARALGVHVPLSKAWERIASMLERVGARCTSMRADPRAACTGVGGAPGRGMPGEGGRSADRALVTYRYIMFVIMYM